MSGQCSICLSDYKDPVCVPCGHVYCSGCLNEYANGPNQGLKAPCPSCRADFHLVTPDLRALHPKYHPFIAPHMRRIFMDTTPGESAADYKKRSKTLSRQVKALQRRERELLETCDRHVLRASQLEDGETQLREQLYQMDAEYDSLQEDNAALHEEIARKNEEVGVLREAARDYRRQGRTLEEKLGRRTDALEAAQARHADLERRMEELTDENARLRRERNEARAEAAALKATTPRLTPAARPSAGIRRQGARRNIALDSDSDSSADEEEEEPLPSMSTFRRSKASNNSRVISSPASSVEQEVEHDEVEQEEVQVQPKRRSSARLASKKDGEEVAPTDTRETPRQPGEQPASSKRRTVASSVTSNSTTSTPRRLTRSLMVGATAGAPPPPESPFKTPVAGPSRLSQSQSQSHAPSLAQSQAQVAPGKEEQETPLPRVRVMRPLPRRMKSKATLIEQHNAELNAEGGRDEGVGAAAQPRKRARLSEPVMPRRNRVLWEHS